MWSGDNGSTRCLSLKVRDRGSNTAISLFSIFSSRIHEVDYTRAFDKLEGCRRAVGGTDYCGVAVSALVQ